MSWISRLRNVARRDQVDLELEEELRFHAEQRAADRGLSADEARRRLGNPLRFREESREIKIAIWLESLLLDIRVALRVWTKRPIIAFAAITTLALGAGMNTAVFQMIWSVMLKPLPYADSGRLVQIWRADEKKERNILMNATLDRWREASRSFAEIASYRPWRVTVADGGEPEQIFVNMVSREFFPMLGVRMLAGRGFESNEVKVGADSFIVLREEYWRRRFGADASIVGREIRVDGVLCKVVGIVADAFTGEALMTATSIGGGTGNNLEPQAYMPLTRARVGGAKAPLPWSYALARLRNDATIAQAEKELATMLPSAERGRVWVASLQNEIGQGFRPALLALMAAAGCVLLIACANVANLLMAQAVMRRRELSIRTALGGGRARVMRQLVTEALVLSFAGGLIGMLLAAGFAKTITALYPEAIPRVSEGGYSWVVPAFALVLTMASSILCGLMPAWRATGESSQASLRVGTALMSRGSRRWADGLVALQVALTAIVLVAAGLLFKSFIVLRNVPLGFDRENIITVNVDLPEARFRTKEDRARFGDAWVERLLSIPGVTAAGVSNSLPLRYTTLFTLGLQIPGEAAQQYIATRGVGGMYFEAMGMKWLDGSPFDPSPKNQVAVNESFVRRYFPGKHVVGMMLPQGDKQPLLITGVVKDVRHMGLREAAEPEVFLPYASWPLNPVDTVVRSALPASQIVPAMRDELRRLDDQIALGRVMTMQEVVDRQLARPRFQALLLGLFSVVAIVLAAVGTYGVIAYNIRSRLQEFGLRRALGANTGDVFRLVFRDGMRAPIIGLVCGLIAGGYVVGRYLKTLLFGIDSQDPLVLAGTGFLLLLTAFAACALPGRLATNVEPLQALRSE